MFTPIEMEYRGVKFVKVTKNGYYDLNGKRYHGLQKVKDTIVDELLANCNIESVEVQGLRKQVEDYIEVNTQLSNTNDKLVEELTKLKNANERLSNLNKDCAEEIVKLNEKVYYLTESNDSDAEKKQLRAENQSLKEEKDQLLSQLKSESFNNDASDELVQYYKKRVNDLEDEISTHDDLSLRYDLLAQALESLNITLRYDYGMDLNSLIKSNYVGVQNDELTFNHEIPADPRATAIDVIASAN